MQRVTVTLDDDLLLALDVLAGRRGYTSRSEALRDIARDAIARASLDEADRPSIGTLSYVYDHETRDLARRLTAEQHHHHNLVTASLHVHLDHDECLEVSVLRGPSGSLRALADAITNQRGVRFGHLHLVPAGEAEAPHGTGENDDRT